jgi:predicted DNA-binding transcriptional regulator AlpA
MPDTIAAPAPDRIVRKREAARLLGVSQTTFWRIERTGQLKPIQILPGLSGYRLSAIETFISTRETGSVDGSRVSAALASPEHGRPGRRRSEH